MAEAVMERERKFAIDEQAPIPELSVAVGDGDISLVKRPTIELRATYFDTADLRLLRSGATLRLRRGGADAGWHLKLPTAEAHLRTELRRPLGADALAGSLEAVPDELVDLAFARLRGAAVEPVAELRTLRTVTEVRDRNGATLVEVADDLVVANPVGEAPVRWREVEVEESPGGSEIAGRIAGLLVESGARPDDGGPKLARALGVTVASTLSPGAGWRAARASHRQRRRPALEPSRVATAMTAATARGPAGTPLAPDGPVPVAHPPVVAAVLGRIAQQAEQLVLQDVAVRRNEDDSVHQMRVASRRLTSALKTFGGLLEESRAIHLCEELKWIAQLLGAARDAEVMRAALEAALDGLPPEQLLGPVRATLSERLVATQLVAGEELALAMRSQRYVALLDELQEFVAAPPLRPGSGRELDRRALRRVRNDLRAVRRQMAGASRRLGRARELCLHDARKRAKRARYALETIAPACGKRAAALAARYEGLQTALGEHHDAFVIAELLREEGARAGVRAGENGYTFGLLAGMQRCRSERGEEAAWRAFERADQRNRRRFLR